MSRAYERGRVGPGREDLAAIAESASVLIIALSLSPCPLASRPHRFLPASSRTALYPRAFYLADVVPPLREEQCMDGSR
jgi:hypothetical protein